MKTLFNIFFLFVISSCKQNKLERSTESSQNSIVHSVESDDSSNVLSSTIEDFNKVTILQAIYSLEGNTLRNFSTSKSNTSIIEINSVIEKSMDSLDYLLTEYSKYLRKFSIVDQTKKLTKIHSWCSFHFVFKAINRLNYEKPVFFEQILYEMPKTKKLFDKYINPNIGQDWGSLDVNQNILLFFDFYKYLTELSAKEQIEIIAEYIRRIR